MKGFLSLAETTLTWFKKMREHSRFWATTRLVYHLIIDLPISPESITATSYDRHGVSNYRSIECLFNRLYRLTTKKHQMSTLRNPPVTGGFPTQRDSNADNVSMFPFHDATCCGLVTGRFHPHHWNHVKMILLIFVNYYPRHDKFTRITTDSRALHIRDQVE